MSGTAMETGGRAEVEEARISPRRGHRLLLVTTALLPVTYVPHEIIPAGPSMTLIIFGLILCVGVRYGVFHARLTPIEVWVAAFALFIGLRLTLAAPFDHVDMSSSLVLAARQVGQLLAGVIMFRVARRAELRPVIVRGLSFALTGMLVMAGYQYVAGLDRLRSLGYLTPSFNYSTAEGTYRPFSTFNGPTVFAGYLAMVGVVVISTAARSRTRLIALGATSVGLLLTETRGAWIAFAIALGITLLRRSEAARRVALRTIAPAIGVALVAVVIVPSLLTSPISRVATLGDSSYVSNRTRAELWAGTMAESLHRPEGHGAESFRVALAPRVGESIARLDHAHSNYLEILYFYGFAGVALFVGVLVSMWRGIRAASRTAGTHVTAAYAALTVYAVDSLVENTWTSLNFTATIFTLVGLGVVPHVVRTAISKSSARRVRAVDMDLLVGDGPCSVAPGISQPSKDGPI